MKYCPKCGAPAEDNADYCSRCGTQLKPHIASFYSPAEPPQSSAEPQKRQRTGKGSGGAPLTLSIVGASLASLSYAVFGFLSFIGLGLCISGIVGGAKSKKAGDPRGLAALIVGIIGAIIAAIAAVLYVIALTNIR